MNNKEAIAYALAQNILTELAKAEPDYCSCPGMFGYATCLFCQPVESPAGMVAHADRCLVLQARRCLEYMKGAQR